MFKCHLIGYSSSNKTGTLYLLGPFPHPQGIPSIFSVSKEYGEALGTFNNKIPKAPLTKNKVV